MAGRKYRVIRGLDYNGRRAEPGDIVDDIPRTSVAWLLTNGDIVAVAATNSDAEEDTNGNKPR